MKHVLVKPMGKMALGAIAFLGAVQIGAAQVPSDLMSNCNQWKITYPDGVEDKTLCDEPNNEFYYVSDNKDAIVFRVPIRSDNGSTKNSDYIRSELRERTPDGKSDIYWTTDGTSQIYVKQAITHLPINKSHLVATQIHGNKADGIDDSMVMRLEGSKLFLSFNGGKLRSDVTIKSNYTLGTVHEVIFKVVDGKHYCYYSEDGNLLNAFNNGNASSYLVKADGNDYVMDKSYDQSYFKVGNYTQSNPEKEGDDTDNPNNYGEVYVYDFEVSHVAGGFDTDGGTVTPSDPVAVSSVSLSASSVSLAIGGTQQLSATVSPSNASNKSVTYSSNDSGVASVSSTGVVTAKTAGSAIITVKTEDGDYTDTVSVTVSAPSTGDNLALNKAITATGSADGTNVVANLVDGNTSTRWSVSGFPQTATIDLGANFVLGSTELVTYSDRAYQYTISVASSQNGTYTQVVNRSNNTTGGSASSPIVDTFSSIEARFVKITVTGADGYTGDWISLLELGIFAGEGEIEEPIINVTSVSLSPSSVSLEEGETQQLSASVSPSNADNKTVSYSSSNTTVATVNASGLVIAKAEGTATITVTTDDGAYTDTTTVTVTAAEEITPPSTGANLALNKTVTATGTADGANLAANLVDGNTGTRWSVSGFPQSATIDLGAAYAIGSTELVTYSNRAYQYTISVASSANGNYTQVVNRSSNTTGGSESSPIVDTFNSVTGRYVKITVTGANEYTGSWVSLLELGVYAGEGDVVEEEEEEEVTPGGSTNVALGKSVNASTEQSANPASNLVDGDEDTRWSAQFYPVSATVNLGGLYTINSTEVICHNDRAYQYVVEVSTDGNSYTQVVNRSNNTTAGTNNTPIADAFSEIDARYVRITVSGAADYTGDWSSIDELRVYGYASSSTSKVGASKIGNSVIVEEAVSVWPNPAINTVNINNAEGFHTVSVYDQMGRMVLSHPMQSTINVSNLNSGVYLVVLSGADKTVTKRILKK